MQQTASGDYLLSPVYDLIDTLIHIPGETFFALSDGLFSEDYETESFKTLGYYAYDDFYEFGIKIGLMPSRLVKLIDKYREVNNLVKVLVQSSFLSKDVKKKYLDHYTSRRTMLNTSFSGKIKESKK